ncbi:beta-hexosaminidase subunit beta-like [Diorhabda sublineata]|uniref:beta-hexosaminidase subunit beta-like n=1 Tax=Diorhabda sublineata TaxID=1163346 RepID=UPI0024E1161F|nr:beta-hexosaminidase subunit beta-like [Diorhabda sublineata]
MSSTYIVMTKMCTLSQVLTISLCVALSESYIEEPGARYPATKGEIWPKPRYQIKNDTYFIIRPQLFKIEIISEGTCSILKDAVVNYEHLIADGLVVVQKNSNLSTESLLKKKWLSDDNYLGYSDTFNVRLDGICNDAEYPTENIQEAYSISVSENEKLLNSSTVWGLLRGLETLSQMVYVADDLLSLRINKSFVDDEPRFSHRGLLLDTSRHFIPLNYILLTLKAMAYNKMNVFHWHIVDDQSFPYVSRKYPELSLQGAYTATKQYSYSDVQTVIEYARLSGIRVIPEFDTPGHTRSWGVSHPELLTACEGELEGKYGPIDPTKNETYDFLKELFTEIHETFADKYIHLGGDEVGFECWKSNSVIQAFMKDRGIEGNFEALESLYIQKIIDMVNGLKSKSIVWEEVFTNGVQVPNDTVIQVWKDLWTMVLDEVTASGKKAILSSCWYLDHLNTGGNWEEFYSCEPTSFTKDPIKQSLLIGGEACMWSEVVNEYNVMSRVWPRASSVAEVLWSPKNDNPDMNFVRRRLEEHTCRMNKRGIAAQPPNGPGFCS